MMTSTNHCHTLRIVYQYVDFVDKISELGIGCDMEK